MKFEFRKGPFFGSVEKIKEKEKVFYVVVTDIVFLFSLFILARIFNLISFNAAVQNISKALFLSLLYYLVLLFLYSLSKYIVLSMIKSTFGKHRLNFSNLGKFYLLNVIIFLVLFGVFFGFGLLAASVKQGLAPYTSLFILVIYSLASYVFLNASQVLFFKNGNIGKSLGNGASFLVNVKKYYGVFLTIAAAFGVAVLLFSVFGSALRNTFFQDYGALLRYGDTYTIIFVHVIGIVFYLAILFNRFYFYSILKQKLK